MASVVRRSFFPSIVPSPASRRPLTVAWIAAVLFALTFAWASPARAAEDVIAHDDFDLGGFSGGYGWYDDWFISDPGKVRVIPGGGVGQVELKLDGYLDRPVDLSTSTDHRLTFWARAHGFGSDDTVTVLASPDDEAWLTVLTITAADSDGADRQYDIDLRAALDAAGMAPSEEFWIGFAADLSGPARFLLDDVSVLGTLPPLPPPPQDFADIVLDGQFDDWNGVSFISDPAGDATHVRGDAARFYWTNVVNQEYVYFMLQRHTTDGQPFNGSNGQTQPVTWYVRIDTNNNGSFTDAGDRIIEVRYSPKPTRGEVSVKIRSAGGQEGWRLLVNNADWGEALGEGGLRAEFRVAWSDLNVSFGQPIRMYAETNRGDRIPDSGDIQWSPASILGPVWLAIGAAFGVLAIWWFRGRRTWTHGSPAS